MSAYLILDLEVLDAERYEQYKAEVPALVARHGGVYRVRGGAAEVIEGEWRPRRIVVITFPDLAAAHAFLADPDYQPVKQIRHAAAQSNVILVEGL